jgi:hypothetical protein
MSNSSTERFQTIGTALAIIISLAAMFVSIYEASILKSQQTSMVWPYLDLSQQYDNNGFAIEISNKGTGPAIITSVQVDYKGLPVESIDVLMDSLNPNRTFGYDILRNSTLGNQVFMSGEKRIVFGLPYNDETRVVQSNLGKVRIRIGYKSVLEEHWYFDSQDFSHVKEKFKATQEFKN